MVYQVTTQNPTLQENFDSSCPIRPLKNAACAIIIRKIRGKPNAPSPPAAPVSPLPSGMSRTQSPRRNHSRKAPETACALLRPNHWFFGVLTAAEEALSGKSAYYPLRIVYSKRVGASLKYWIISGLAAGIGLGTSCGAPPSPNQRSPEYVASREAPCLNCESEIPSPQKTTTLKESDIIKVSPTHLSFFNDFDGGLSETDSVTVINSTERTVLLSNVQVQHVRIHQAEKSGATYFTTDWPPGNSVVLQPGFEAQIAVTFSPTTEQRSALLVITTSHPEFTQLEVSLTGKHFITSGGF